jgi:hypothetical protein
MMVSIRGLRPAQLAQLAWPKMARASGTYRVFICIADHYEPFWRRPVKATARERVARWVRKYPNSVQGIQDNNGRAPQHTFFYPQDEYECEVALVDQIATLCDQDFGDIEVHLHHDGDTADGLREKLLTFTERLHGRHGRLRRDDQGQLTYAFIHGNWALNNSRPDGRWCGVDNEIEVLRETGCYCDMTMPAAPDPCQTRTVNSIYYATGFRNAAKAHDGGPLATVGQPPPGRSLLMIQGPLALDWRQRKLRVLPRLENGDLTPRRPPSLDRLALWLQAGVQVVKQRNWYFIKLHTHGAQEANASMLLGEPMRQFHLGLANYAARQDDFRYFYVTAREMAALVRQAEAGATEPDLNFPAK